MRFVPPPDLRIGELCAKVVSTTDPAELEPIVTELRAALHEHIQRLRSETAREIPLFFNQNEAAD
jgi:hypothetical protein